MTTAEIKLPERRFCKRKAQVQKRDDGKKVITGYAAVFYNPADRGTVYEMWTGYEERILKGAFDYVLKSAELDCRALKNHDPNCLLGRTKPGTCKLSVDQVGLFYEIDPPDTEEGRATVISIERGDIDGSSFSFMCGGEGGRVTYGQEGQTEIREIASVSDLLDVGPVTYPAYLATSAGTRDRSSIEKERAAFIQERNAAAGPDEVAVRLALLRSQRV